MNNEITVDEEKDKETVYKNPLYKMQRDEEEVKAPLFSVEDFSEILAANTAQEGDADAYMGLVMELANSMGGFTAWTVGWYEELANLADKLYESENNEEHFPKAGQEQDFYLHLQRYIISETSPSGVLGDFDGSRYVFSSRVSAVILFYLSMCLHYRKNQTNHLEGFWMKFLRCWGAFQRFCHSTECPKTTKGTMKVRSNDILTVLYCLEDGIDKDQWCNGLCSFGSAAGLGVSPPSGDIAAGTCSPFLILSCDGGWWRPPKFDRTPDSLLKNKMSVGLYLLLESILNPAARVPNLRALCKMGELHHLTQLHDKGKQHDFFKLIAIVLEILRFVGLEGEHANNILDNQFAVFPVQFSVTLFGLINYQRMLQNKKPLKFIIA